MFTNKKGSLISGTGFIFVLVSQGEIFPGNPLYCSNSFLKHLQVELTDEKSGRLFQVKIFTLVKDLKLVLIRNRYV